MSFFPKQIQQHLAITITSIKVFNQNCEHSYYCYYYYYYPHYYPWPPCAHGGLGFTDPVVTSSYE